MRIRAKTARNCIARGVYLLSVTTTPSAWNGTSALASGATRIRTGLGLHPQPARCSAGQSSLLFDQLLPMTRYVGEVGLDAAPEFMSHWHDQMAVFNHIVGACSRGRRANSVYCTVAAPRPQSSMFLRRIPTSGHQFSTGSRAHNWS